MGKVLVVIPNWNGADELPDCIDSVLKQSQKPHLVVVDNGSVDNSVELIEERYPEVEIVRHDTNKGYAGGVNPGFRLAIERGFDYVAPFNNDAVADKDWIKHLAAYLDTHNEAGIVAAKLLSSDGKHIDSTGDLYTTWGLPYPRGRDEADPHKYDHDTDILGASGGSSMYRVSMLKEIGLLDEDFFAYYEDVDISLRAQLAGWKVAYVPQAVVYHQISTTSRKIKGFFTQQTIKNYPMLFIKDVPLSLWPHMLPRFTLAYLLFTARAVQRGHIRWVLKATGMWLRLLPKKMQERHKIQSTRRVNPDYIWSILTHDLPPNAHNLRKLRSTWWKLRGRL